MRKDYVQEMKEKMSWPRRVWWEIWDTRLYWKLTYIWDWILDKPYWKSSDSHDEDWYLETCRTKKRIEE